MFILIFVYLPSNAVSYLRTRTVLSILKNHSIAQPRENLLKIIIFINYEVKLLVMEIAQMRWPT